MTTFPARSQADTAARVANSRKLCRLNDILNWFMTKHNWPTYDDLAELVQTNLSAWGQNFNTELQDLVEHGVLAYENHTYRLTMLGFEEIARCGLALLQAQAT